MAEKPILFSAPMVRALLAGSKTQTRRVVKEYAPGLIRVRRNHGRGCLAYLTDRGVEWRPYGGAPYEAYPRWADCAPHATGDLLWVRETCLMLPSRIIYCADMDSSDDDFARGIRRTPSIFMPRAASRITLRVTGVRVERLQAITEADAIAEGVAATSTPGLGWLSARANYCTLWESINGAGSWDANPWVWIYDFVRVTP